MIFLIKKMFDFTKQNYPMNQIGFNAKISKISFFVTNVYKQGISRTKQDDAILIINYKMHLGNILNAIAYILHPSYPFGKKAPVVRRYCIDSLQFSENCKTHIAQQVVILHLEKK